MSRLFTKPRKNAAAKAEKAAAAHTANVAESLAEIPSDTPDHALQILRLSHEGRGVARNAEGKAVFVEGALPGERVTCKVRFTRSRYDEAVVDQVLVPSPRRTVPACPHYVACGGCNLQHLDAEGQLAFKQSLVAELLDYPQDRMQPALTSPAFGYRRKARLGVKWRKDGRLLLGFREKNSAFITNITECPVLVPELQALLPALYELLPQLEGKKHLGHIELIQGENRCGVLVRLLRPLERMSHRDQRLWRDWAKAQAVALLWQDEAGIHSSEVDEAEALFSYHLQQQTLFFAASDFVQVNADVNEQMVAQALDWLKLKGTERVLDLFCGFGNFTLPLASQAKAVLGVEGLESQVQRARLNAAHNHCDNVRFTTADLSRPLQQQAWNEAASGWDVILLDPPRAGADGICDQLGELGAKQILYISCNPATLARDKASLERQGYQLERLGMMDMFPQTAHVESMALFVRH